jgi:DNA ligase (NAD+)
MSLEELKAKLEEANRLYRTGDESPLSDAEYDYLLEQIKDEAFRNRVGYEIEKNKIELPVPMGSLTKVKSREELFDWSKSKKFDKNAEVCITPKYDGLSLLVSYEAGVFSGAYTRGDGIFGQDVTEHFKATPMASYHLPEDFTGYLIGECIMAEALFEEKYSAKFKNPRNMVAGLLSRKTLSRELSDVCYVAYGVREAKMADKRSQVEFCNRWINSQWQYVVVPEVQKLSELNDEKLQAYFDNETVYQCDGLVLELNNADLFHGLGKETNSLNPAGARAWKPESDDTRTSLVREIAWQISKNGAAKPVVRIEPVDLAGVTISNVTGINARFINDNGIASGATVTIIRSGDVIPKIVSVPMPAEKAELPEACPACQSSMKWNANEIDLLCSDDQCPDRLKAQIIDFFATLKADEVGEGIISALWTAGYNSVKEMLNLTVEDLLKLEGFKQRKAKKVVDSMAACVKNVPLPRLQHASNLFRGLGEKKLEVLQQYDDSEKRPHILDLLNFEGYSDITAKAYLEGFDLYWNWVAELPGVTYEKIEVNAEGQFAGKALVFTGFRASELEKVIKAQGGKITGSVSKKTHALVVKAKGSGSSKEKKAIDLGIPVYTQEEFEAIVAGETSSSEKNDSNLQAVENLPNQASEEDDQGELFQPSLF